MTGHDAIHPADVELLERLAAIAEIVDPAPSEVREMGYAAFAFRDPDAALLHEVAAESGEMSAVRATGSTSHLHFFEFGELSIDLEVTTRGTFTKVLGVVTDPAGVVGRTMTVESKAASFTTELDAGGRFTVEQVPLGLIRLVVEGANGQHLTTPWFEAS